MNPEDETGSQSCGSQFIGDARRHRAGPLEITHGDPPARHDLDEPRSLEEQSNFLRALAARRNTSAVQETILNLQIQRAIHRIFEFQRPGGGGSFTPDDTPFTPVEPTARALIALAEAGHPQDGAIESALQFLTRQIRPSDGSVQSSDDAIDEGWPGGPEVTDRIRERLGPDIGIRRTHPAALTLLALSKWKGTKPRLKSIRSFLTGQYGRDGWGAFPETAPSPAFTAVAVQALIASGLRPYRFRHSSALIRRSQLASGRWPEQVEVWSVRRDDRTIPSLSQIDTTVKAIDALLLTSRLVDLRSVEAGMRSFEADRLATVRPDHLAVERRLHSEPAQDLGLSDEITAVLDRVHHARSVSQPRLVKWSSHVTSFGAGSNA